jgi:hypothetical protein
MLKKIWRWLWPEDTWEIHPRIPHSWTKWGMVGDHQERFCKTCNLRESVAFRPNLFEREPECTNEEVRS